MWEFKTFPTKLEYIDLNARTEAVYRVEIFGIIKMGDDVSLVVFRELAYSVGFDVGKIEILPFKEFYTKYKKFKMMEGAQ